MVEKISQEGLLALELFRLNPKSRVSQEIIIQHLVEVSMYNNPLATSTNEIVKACLNLLKQPAGFSDIECKGAIKECRRNGRIKRISHDKFVLGEAVQKELQDRIIQFEKAEKSFNEGLIESVGRALNTVVYVLAESLLCGIVRDTIQEVFFNNAIRIYSSLKSGGDILSNINQGNKIKSQLSNKLRPFSVIQGKAPLDKVLEGVIIFLSNLNELQKNYIGNLHRRVCYFQVLNVDPRLQQIQKENLSKIRLYLDTNVAIEWLCKGTWSHQAVSDVLEASKSLDIKLFISPITMKEIEGVITEGLKYGHFLQDGRVTRVLQVGSRKVRNPVVEGFLGLKNKHQNLNWNAYISPFKNLEELLLNHGVIVEKECCENLTSDESYPKVYKEIIDIKQESGPNILEHDASNFILMQRLRKIYPGTVIGSSVWLITFDKGLLRLDRNLRSDFPIPHCRPVGNLAELLLSFQSTGKFIATDDYINYLASQNLGAYISEDTFDMHIFDLLSNAEVVYDTMLNLEPELASAIIRDLQQDREANSLLEQIQKVDKEEQKNLEQELFKKIFDIQSITIKAINKKNKDEVERLQTGISEISQRLQILEHGKQTTNETISNISGNLNSAKGQLLALESMSFWGRIKFLFKK